MSVKLENGIIDIEENLILKKDGSVFAIYEIEPYVVNLVSDKAKENAKAVVSDTLLELEEYRHFDIAVLPYPKDILGKFKTLSQSFSKDTEDMAYSVIEGAYDYLNTSKELSEDKWFISVPLKSFHLSDDVKEVLDASLASASNLLVDILGLKKEILVNWSQDYHKQRLDLEERLSTLQYRRLEEAETQFVNGYFYIQSSYCDKAFETRFIDNAIENLGDRDISFEQISHLTFSLEEGDNHVAYLPIAYKPENASYSHLYEKIQDLEFPVASFTSSVFSRTSGLPINNLRTKGRWARSKLKGAQREQAESGTVGKRSIARSKFLVEEMERKIDNGVPMLSSLQILVVSDFDKKVLKQKVALLTKAMKDCQIRLSKATPYQLYLFAKTRFGNVLDSDDKNFLQAMEVGAFVEDLLFIKKQVGQDVGFYLGMIDNHTHSWHSRYEKALGVASQPVFVNLFEANEAVDGKDTSNPHIQVSGETGSGKSFLVSYLHFYASLLNCKTLYVDPKCEKRYWYQETLKALEESQTYPELQAYIRSLHFVTLDHTKKENEGVLDPLTFLEVSEAKDLIVSMINEFHNLDNEKRFKTALLKKITEFGEKRASGELVGTLSIFEDLRQSDDGAVKDMADLLVEEVTDSVLSLIFSNGQNQSVNLKARNTILEIKGLDLPTKEDGQLTLQNRKSLAVMYALGHYCIRFGEQDYGEKTLEVIDEAWTFNMTSYGRGLIDRIKRVGRSQNNFLLFVSQKIDDSSQGDETSDFGTYFCFYNSGEQEADKVLGRLKVPKSKLSRAWFNNLTQGQCLFKDTYGRVERITIHGLFPHVNNLFKTVRKKVV